MSKKYKFICCFNMRKCVFEVNDPREKGIYFKANCGSVPLHLVFLDLKHHCVADLIWLLDKQQAATPPTLGLQ